MNDNLGKINGEAKSGNESFRYNNRELDFKLIDFWKWSKSDLLNNTLRGILAEYIVKQDLKVTKSIRTEWDAYDLIMDDGTKIEVKSASYLQSWKQNRLSDISFDISPTKGWNAETNEYATQIERQSDFYVFCLLDHKDKSTINPLDLDQWNFFILPTQILNEKKATQKRISLNALIKLCPTECKYSQIKESIQKSKTIV